MWSVYQRLHRLGTPFGLSLLLTVSAVACGGEAAGELGAVPTVGRAQAGQSEIGSVGANTRDPSSAEAPSNDRIRRGGQGPESILEFGLFGPVVPTLESEGYYQSDCRFENDPYETCL